MGLIFYFRHAQMKWLVRLGASLTKLGVQPAATVVFRLPEPVSAERSTWAKQRVYMLDRCIKDLVRRQAFYHHQGAANANVQAQAMQTMQAERLLLLIELNVLNDMLKE